MPTRPYRVSWVDQERCFNLVWGERRSMREVSTNFEQEGIRNPRTGERVTPSAISQAAWRWACHHVPETREVVRALYADWGQVMADDELDRLYMTRARHVLSGGGLKKFITENHFEKYLK